MRQLVAGVVKRNPAFEYLARRLVSVWPYARRQSKDFWAYYRLLHDAEYLDLPRVLELQEQRLLDTVRDAYASSAFYRELYDEHGVNVAKLQSARDVVRQVPVVEKEQLRDRSDVTVPNRGNVLGLTSGTSGSPFAFAMDRRCDAMEQAAIFHQWEKAGFTPGSPRVEMRGFQTEPVVEYPDFRLTRFSVVNMTANMPRFVAMLNRRRTAFLHGYPSAIAKFALELREQNLRLDYQIRGVFLASEPVYEWQTNLIREQIAPAMIVAHYGTAERVVLGAWCEHRSAYHMLPLYGYYETDGTGAIIGTGFLNRATPFVRYRSSDIAMDVSAAPCDACGRSLTPVVGRIGGRLEDYLVDEKDELIPPATVTFPFKKLRAIRAVQIVQDESRNLVLRCVTRAADAPDLFADREVLSAGLQRMLGPSIRVRFDDVPDLPVTDAGKFKWIISHAAKVRRLHSAAS